MIKKTNLENILTQTLNNLIITDIQNEIDFYTKPAIINKLKKKYLCIENIKIQKNIAHWIFKGSKTTYGLPIR